MTQLVSQNVRLRELTGRAEARTQLVVKREVDVQLLIDRTIERAHRRLPDAAARGRGVAEKDQLRRAPRCSSRRGQNPGPGRFRRVEHERNELNLSSFLGRFVDRSARSASARPE